MTTFPRMREDGKVGRLAGATVQPSPACCAAAPLTESGKWPRTGADRLPEGPHESLHRLATAPVTTGALLARRLRCRALTKLRGCQFSCSRMSVECARVAILSALLTDTSQRCKREGT